jgi:hypothetical protein
VRARVLSLAAFLAARVPRDATDSRVTSIAICSRNCEEWLLADFACAITGFVSVGIHGELPTQKRRRCSTTSARLLRWLTRRMATSRPIVRCLSSVPSLKPGGHQLSAIVAAQAVQNLFSDCLSSSTAPKGLALPKVRWQSDSSSVKSFGEFTVASDSPPAQGMDRVVLAGAVASASRGAVV